jgi:hypothetical protein
MTAVSGTTVSHDIRRPDGIVRGSFQHCSRRWRLVTVATSGRPRTRAKSKYESPRIRERRLPIPRIATIVGNTFHDKPPWAEIALVNGDSNQTWQ